MHVLRDSSGILVPGIIVPKKARRNAVDWEFEADYYTGCNCDWGCPCNFNARPTEGHCHGGGVWRVRRGHFGSTKLDGVTFADMYWFPGLVEKGNGRTRLYVDREATPAQREAVEMIESGKVGGGVFEFSPSSRRSGTRSWSRTSSSGWRGRARTRGSGT